MSGLRWTPEQFAEYTKRRESERMLYRPLQPVVEPAGTAGILRFKSKAEARYAEVLESRKRAGEVADWDYEALTLVVGRAGKMVSRITPDFVVHRHDNLVELHEVKGWLRDDARAKLLAAVRQWPGFVWWLVWAKRGGFEHQRLT